MKKYLLVILIVLMVVSVSGCITDNNNENQTKIVSLSREDVVISYPSDWVESNAESNYSIVSIASSDSINLNKVAEVNVNVEKQKLNGTDFINFINGTYHQLNKSSSVNLISSGNTTVSGQPAYEYTYSSISDRGLVRSHQAFWLERNGYAYVILCSAPENEFKNYESIFDFIVSNIKFNN